ncbi:hypothetical protein SAMN05192583_3735 [Sphingomonas gellani]|uniref:Uncharacterized protein n=1 Tax=Sphingomonas gellani TaxID=1166340 RepID=A0A1H8K0N4_9SPHN|nr:hypothetical protein SAMN05192583_3735 [Sphingomonas gellani]
MNVSVIVGLLLFAIPVVIIWAGFVSDNVFLNLHVDTNRRSAPVTFWAVTGMWTLMAGIGLMVVLANWGK